LDHPGHHRPRCRHRLDSLMDQRCARPRSRTRAARAATGTGDRSRAGAAPSPR
jgi:hypothetical protein